MQGGIFIVIYVDVLVCVNFFITFLLLEISSKFAKKEANTVRFIIASFIGGIYSLIIFVDNLPGILLEISKLLSCAVIIAVAFKFSRLTQYIKLIGIYYFSSVVFLGITMLLCFVLKLKFVAVNNSVIYFNLSAPAIILSAIIAYTVSGLIIKIYNRTLSKKEIYILVIEQDGCVYNLSAFLDTGNRLREPFSDTPIIIVDSAKLPVNIDSVKTRFVPVSTVSGRTMLKAFKPDKIILKSGNSSEVIENAYVALSNDLCDNKFSAILNYDILSV